MTKRTETDRNWKWVREQFRAHPYEANFAGMLITRHPAPVRRAIKLHREQLDRHPWTYFCERRFPLLRR
jgi:hypothetical protein